VSRGSGWILALIAVGWAIWVVGVVDLVLGERLQSGIAPEHGDSSQGVRRVLIVGFVFLFVASILGLARWSDNRRRR
jgi:hypothetical protein